MARLLDLFWIALKILGLIKQAEDEIQNKSTSTPTKLNIPKRETVDKTDPQNKYNLND